MELSGWIDAASRMAAGAAIASVWQGLLLAAALWACLKLTPRLSASVRFAVWSAAFLAILLLPIFSFAHKLGVPAVISGNIATSNPGVVHLDLRWGLAIAALWLVLAFIRAVALVKSGLRARSLWKNSTPVDVDDSLRTVLKRAAGLRAVDVFSSSEVDQPCVIGFFKPRILVPEWLLTKATHAEIRQIALHEASHLRRWDDWTNLLQKLATMLFPLNPALAWVERRLCCEREEACDECVVRETHSAREYAVCLTNLAAERMERRLRMRQAALSLGAWERRSALAVRIHSILRSGSQLSSAKARAIMAALLVATAAGAVKLSSTSELVAFSSDETPASKLAEQARPATIPASAYHDVVFREAVAGDHPGVPKVIASDVPARSRLIAKPLRLKARRTHSGSSAALARRASLSSGEPPSWILVTRWEGSTGRQAPVMVIQSVVRFSAPSAGGSAANGVAAVQMQTGWFVFQL